MEVIDMLTKGAIGNLINRYRAVLKKCHLMNTFGSLAVASMLVMGAAGAAMGAVAQIGNNQYDSLAAAVDAAQSGDTIVLLQDFQGSGVKIDTAKKTTLPLIWEDTNTPSSILPWVLPEQKPTASSS